MEYEDFLDLAHDRCMMTVFVASDGHNSLGQSSRKGYLAAMKQAEADLWVTRGANRSLITAEEVSLPIYFKYRSWGLWKDEDLKNSPIERIRFEVEFDEVYRNARGGYKKISAKRDAFWEKWEHLDLDLTGDGAVDDTAATQKML